MFVTVFNIILTMHVAAGTMALGSAGIAIFSRKGATIHRRFGRIYALAMSVAVLSALVLALLDLNAFLLLISLFTLYLVFTGWRAAVVRSGVQGRLDRVIGGGMGLLGMGMIGWGCATLSMNGSQPASVLIVFGTIGVVLALTDWRHWRRGAIAGTSRTVRHLSRMLAATIATLTATAVVNLGHLPAVLVWLGPTLLLAPVITWWIHRVNRSDSQTEPVR